MPGRAKPSSGQLNFIGDIFRLQLKYEPHIESTDLGDKVVVVRVPEGATTTERLLALDEAAKLARTIKTTGRRFRKKRAE